MLEEKTIKERLAWMQARHNELHQASSPWQSYTAVAVHVLRWVLGMECAMKLPCEVVDELVKSGKLKELQDIRPFRGATDFYTARVYEKTGP